MYDNTTRERVRSLRKDGLALSAISAATGVAQSTVSVMVRDLPVPIAALHRPRAMLKRISEAGNRGRQAQRDARWAVWQAEAQLAWETLQHNAEFMFGLALYIGEGTKASLSSVVLTNADARVIKAGIKFYSLIGVPPLRVRVSLHIHSINDADRAMKWWSDTLGIPLAQFHAPQRKTSRSSKGKQGNTLPLGVVQLCASHTETRVKLEVWMNNALGMVP